MIDPPLAPHDDASSPGLRVLLVEDSEDDALLLIRHLRVGAFRPVHRRVDTRDAMADALSEPWDVIICDYAMPSFSALDALDLVRSRGLDLPFIIVSGAIGEDIAVVAMKAGAHDYLMKDNLTRLAPAIEREMREAQVRSARRQAEAEARENLELFWQVFEQNENAIVILNPDSAEILNANPAAERLYGYPREALFGVRPGALFPDEEAAQRERFLDGIRSDAGFVLPMVCQRRRDRSRIIVAIHGQPIRLQRRRLFYCTLFDITEKIRLEEEAKRRQLQLIQANKMAALGTLVAGVAHEINNPNNFVGMNARLLADAWRDALPILQRYAQTDSVLLLGGLPFAEMQSVIPSLLDGIADGSERIKRIVENLKDFARQEQSGVDQEVDLNGVIHAAVTIIQNLIKRCTHHFRLELAEDLPRVKGNAQRLEQVVINLIMNALQALPDPGHGVTVRTARALRPGWAVLTVEDQGCGIRPEDMGRIMDPFFTTKVDSGGTGLGLSISYAIIEEHNGKMEFSSVPGEGTRATIALPAWG
jgi:PAS domain S-box-containing protein